MSGGRSLDLGAALRALRRHRDLSQRQLADLAGMPVSTLARIESGEVTNPRLRTMERLVQAAGGAISVDLQSGQPAEPIRYEQLTDAGCRHFPAHLDVRVTYPFLGRDRRILPPGTAVYRFHRDRGLRDEARAEREAVEALEIQRFERAGDAAWLWLARTDIGTMVGKLGALLLPREWPDTWLRRPEAVVCGLEVAPYWRDRGLEQRLLGCLRSELSGRGPTELVTLAYHGPEAEPLRRLGFHSRVGTVSLLTKRWHQ